MPERSYQDRLVDEVTTKVVQRPSTDADQQVVRARAEEAVEELIDAPIQAFVPLLAENAVISGLRGSRAQDEDLPPRTSAGPGAPHRPASA